MDKKKIKNPFLDDIRDCFMPEKDDKIKSKPKTKEETDKIAENLMKALRGELK